MSGPEISFTTMIERLKTYELKLTAELQESNDRATEAKGHKKLVEKEATRLKLRF